MGESPFSQTDLMAFQSPEDKKCKQFKTGKEGGREKVKEEEKEDEEENSQVCELEKGKNKPRKNKMSHGHLSYFSNSHNNFSHSDKTKDETTNSPTNLTNFMVHVSSLHNKIQPKQGDSF